MYCACGARAGTQLPLPGAPGKELTSQFTASCCNAFVVLVISSGRNLIHIFTSRFSYDRNFVFIEQTPHYTLQMHRARLGRHPTLPAFRSNWTEPTTGVQHQ